MIQAPFEPKALAKGHWDKAQSEIETEGQSTGQQERWFKMKLQCSIVNQRKIIEWSKTETERWKKKSFNPLFILLSLPLSLSLCLSLSLEMKENKSVRDKERKREREIKRRESLRIWWKCPSNCTQICAPEEDERKSGKRSILRKECTQKERERERERGSATGGSAYTSARSVRTANEQLSARGTNDGPAATAQSREVQTLRANPLVYVYVCVLFLSFFPTHRRNRTYLVDCQLANFQ